MFHTLSTPIKYFLATVCSLFVLLTMTSCGTQAPVYDGEKASGNISFSLTGNATASKAIEDIVLQIDRIELQDEQRAQISISTGKQQFSLVQLNVNELPTWFSSAQLNTWMYTSLTMKIGQVMVTTSDGQKKKATLASDIITFPITVPVAKDTHTHVQFDILNSLSLHKTADDDYVFVPTMKTHVYDDTTVYVAEDKEHFATIVGTPVSTTHIGTDLDGSFKRNFHLPEDAYLKINEDGSIEIDTNPQPTATSEDDSRNTLSGTAVVEDEDGNLKEIEVKMDMGNGTIEMVEDDDEGSDLSDVDVSQTSLKGVELFVESPLPNSAIKSPLTVSGHAPGYWFFEGSFPVILTNWDGLIIAEGIAEAQSSWMTEEQVEYKAELTFEKPSYNDRGTIILHRANASGESERDDAVEYTVKFE